MQVVSFALSPAHWRSRRPRAGRGRGCASWPRPKISRRSRARSAATRSPSSALAKGYQDPHFVDPKPSFILAVSRADLLIAVGRELEIGWLPPLITSSRNAKIQPGANGYLDASLNVKILEIPTGQITRAMGDVHPQGNPHYWLDPGNGRPIAQAIRDKLSELVAGRQGAYFDAALRRLRQAAGGRREALGRDDGAVQGHEDRDLPPLVAELHGALRPGRDRATSSRSPAFRRRRRTRSSSSTR